MMAEAGTPRSTGDYDFYRAIGRFASHSDANNFVNRTLEQNIASIDAVAAGTLTDAWFEVRFGYPTGTEAIVLNDSGEPKIRRTYYVGVEIIHDPNSPNGYTVSTAYPINEYPDEGHF